MLEPWGADLFGFTEAASYVNAALGSGASVGAGLGVCADGVDTLNAAVRQVRAAPAASRESDFMIGYDGSRGSMVNSLRLVSSISWRAVRAWDRSAGCNEHQFKKGAA
jgi:hypothetical protein